MGFIESVIIWCVEGFWIKHTVWWCHKYPIFLLFFFFHQINHKPLELSVCPSVSRKILTRFIWCHQVASSCTVHWCCSSPSLCTWWPSRSQRSSWRSCWWWRWPSGPGTGWWWWRSSSAWPATWLPWPSSTSTLVGVSLFFSWLYVDWQGRVERMGLKTGLAARITRKASCERSRKQRTCNSGSTGPFNLRVQRFLKTNYFSKNYNKSCGAEL